jgi:hypothetical protein
MIDVVGAEYVRRLVRHHLDDLQRAVIAFDGRQGDRNLVLTSNLVGNAIQNDGQGGNRLDVGKACGVAERILTVVVESNAEVPRVIDRLGENDRDGLAWTEPVDAGGVRRAGEP